jgi:hypothetical protein
VTRRFIRQEVKVRRDRRWIVERWAKRASTAVRRLANLLWRSGPPEDPYSYVTAPKKPRPPHLSASAVAELPER